MPCGSITKFTPRRRVIPLAAALWFGAWLSAAAQTSVAADTGSGGPRAAIKAALASARSDHKLVLIDFTADWCLDCGVLDALMRDTSVAPFLRDHFHVVRVDVGFFRDNLDVAAEYGDPIFGGIPAVVLLGPDGKTRGSTKDGALAHARTMVPAELSELLEQWARPLPTEPARWVLTHFTESEVSVTLSLERALDGSLTVIGTISPDRPGFHLYGKDLPLAGLDGIGRPTRIEIVDAPIIGHLQATGVTAVSSVTNGVLAADRAADPLPVPSLGKVFPVYSAGPVTLRLPIEVLSRTVTTLVVSVTYESCSDAVCLAPVIDKRVTVTIPADAR